MSYNLNDLSKSLMAQLNEIVTGNPLGSTSQADSFLTWCRPGFAVREENFEFAIGGWTSAKDAAEQRRLLFQANQFARMVDFIPDVSGMLTLDKQAIYHRVSQASLAYMYGEILRLSKVADRELTPDNERKIENWRKAQTPDLIREYNKYARQYRRALSTYTAKRIAAAVAEGPQGRAAVMEWASMQQLWRDDAHQALMEWENDGRKNEIERWRASVSQMTGRSMKLWKERLLKDYNDSRVSLTEAGAYFFTTFPNPNDFALSEGWEEYKFYSEQKDFHSNYSTSTHTSEWQVSGDMTWDIFSFMPDIGGGTPNYQVHKSSDSSISEFGLSFEITQVAIDRTWFHPEFFMNRGWTLQKGKGWNYDKFPSDGENPPIGNFIGYPSTMLVARNIEIISREVAEEYDKWQKKQSRERKYSGGFAIGPFKVSGSYESSSSSESDAESFSSDKTEKSLRVPGMQVIGFVNRLIPKAPNPLEEFDDSEFE